MSRAAGVDKMVFARSPGNLEAGGSSLALIKHFSILSLPFLPASSCSFVHVCLTAL